MGYRIYNGTQLITTISNKSYTVTGLKPNTSYQLAVTNYNGSRESSKTTITVKTRGIRLVIPVSLTVNSIITLNYQEYSLGLVPIGTEPAGMFGGGNKRNIQAKVISVASGKSTIELLDSSNEFSDNTQMNKLQDGSFAAFNGYKAIYFRQ